METKTNWLALIISIILCMGLGYLWYGVLFTHQWMAGNGITMVDGVAMKNGTAMPMTNLPMIVNTISLVVYAYLMNWLVNRSGSFTFQSGATVGAVVGIINFFRIYTGNRFAGNPTSLSMIDGSYTLLIFIVIGAVIGGWRSK